MEAMRELVTGLEAVRQRDDEARAEPLPDSVTVAELRQELRALAATLQE